MVCTPDSQLRVRPSMENKAATVWATASRAHISREFRFNSQPLSVAITETPTIGGRAWPNVRFNQAGFDLAFAIWGNSTLGLITHWWHSNRQVSGRGAMSIRSADSLLVLDLRTLTCHTTGFPVHGYDTQNGSANLVPREGGLRMSLCQGRRRHRKRPFFFESWAPCGLQ